MATIEELEADIQPHRISHHLWAYLVRELQSMIDQPEDEWCDDARVVAAAIRKVVGHG